MIQRVITPKRDQSHRPRVLLRVYAKCIAGQQDEAKRRIEDATKPPPGDHVDDVTPGDEDQEE